jgi:hypothetical protein
MFDKNKLTPDAKEYFDSLPMLLQESIMQQSVDMNTKEDLENFFAHVVRGLLIQRLRAAQPVLYTGNNRIRVPREVCRWRQSGLHVVRSETDVHPVVLPLTAAAAALGVLLFALLYNGGGAASLAAANVQPAASPTQAQDKLLDIDVEQGAQNNIEPGDTTQAPSTDGRLLPYLEGTLWGYKNAKGQTVIEPRFLRALEFLKESGAFAAVEQDGELLYGLLARDGSWVTEPIWSDVRGFSEGLAAVERDDKWGYVDAAGKAVIPCAYREAGDFCCGRARVRPGSTFGYVDPDGDMAIEAQFDAAGDFGSDMAFVGAGRQAVHHR